MPVSEYQTGNVASNANSNPPSANNPVGPKLQNVKYTSILPMGKTSGYVAGEKVQFAIPPEIPYFDGKQSYLLVHLRNTSTWGTVAEIGNDAAGNPVAPTGRPAFCFPPNMGGHAIINRLQIQDQKGLNLEDLEAYNMNVGILSAYKNDSDIYGTLAKVEGIGGRNIKENNMLSGDLKVNYFTHNPNIGAADANGSYAFTGGNQDRENTFCLPINAGLFSGFGDEHFAYPNLDIGGTKMTFYLEKADRIMQTLCGEFPSILPATATGEANLECLNIAQANDPAAFTGNATGATGFRLQRCHNQQINHRLNLGSVPTTAPANANAYPGNAVRWSNNMPFRVGQLIRVGGGSLAAAGELARITQITMCGTTNGTTGFSCPLIEHTQVSAGDGTTIRLETDLSARSYVIDKIELRLLETIPDAPTIKMIRSAMNRGLNYHTYQLNKVSTAAGLVNAVIDIPTAITRGLSILVAPIQQANMNTKDRDNSYVCPRVDADLGTATQYTYQWQVRNILIPNIEVVTDNRANTDNDNVIFLNQLQMALRPMITCKALGDHQDRGNIANHGNARLNDVLTNPYVFPLPLAPNGVSYNLMESDPQLRITNVGAAPLAKLHHIFINHTRKITANNAGVEVSL